MQKKKCKQGEKKGNYQHFNKVDTLNNDNENGNRVTVWISHLNE